MLIRIAMPAVLGLALLLPAGQASFAEPGSGQPALQNTLRLAQAAEQKSDDDEAEERGKGRRDRGKAKEERPSREDRGRGGKEAQQQQQQRGQDDAEKARRGAAEQLRQKQEAAREAARKAAEEKQEAARRAAEQQRQAEQEAARKAAAEKQRAEQDAARRAAEDKQRAEETRDRESRERRAREQTKTREQTKETQPATTQQRTPEPQAQPQQQRTTGDDRRRRGDRDRDRGPRDATRVQELVKERESRRTSAQELQKTQVTSEPTRIDGGARTLRREGNRIEIRSNDTARLRGDRGNQRVEQLGGGQTRTIVVYPDGTQIITVTDHRGAIVHRSRRDRGGREVVLVREIKRPPLAQINLGPLRITMPREHYIVDARRASRRDMYAALIAPPVEPVPQYYSLEEIRRFDRVRDIMPRIDISTITFDTDSAIISPGQIEMLADLADIMNELIDENPDEVFLIEGHTDGVGSDLHNLALSDRRAEAVAIALTYYFDVPAENLVTQGFGKAFPKIPTELAERENRRVAVRRVTPLMAQR